MARFTQADITRAILGAQKAGFKVAKVTIDLDGTITLDFADQPVRDGSDWRDRSPLYHPELSKRKPRGRGGLGKREDTE